MARDILHKRIDRFAAAANNGGVQHLDFTPDKTFIVLVERDAVSSIRYHRNAAAFWEKARRVAHAARLLTPKA